MILGDTPLKNPKLLNNYDFEDDDENINYLNN
jgi:hypothetical protein